MPLSCLVRKLAATACALSMGVAAAVAQEKFDAGLMGLSETHLQARQAAAEARKDLSPATKSKVVALYAGAIADVERASHIREETARLREALRTAPSERRRLDKLLEEVQRRADVPESMSALAALSDEKLERQETAARADYDDARLQLDRLESEHDLLVSRPDTLAQEQDEARAALDQIRAALVMPSDSDELGVLPEAQRLAARARAMVLEAELGRQAAESAYLPAQRNILELRLDVARARSQQAEARAKLLLQASAARQRAEAERAVAEAVRNSSRPGVLRDLVIQNAQLKAQLLETDLDSTLLEVSALRSTAEELDMRSRAIQRAAASRTLRSEFVAALLERLHSLPTGEVFSGRREAWSKLAVATLASNLRTTSLLVELRDLDAAVTGTVRSADLPEGEAPALQHAVHEQLVVKRQVLRRLDEQEKALLRALRDAEVAEEEVLARSALARDQTIRLLVWIPFDPIGVTTLANLGGALAWTFSPARWSSTSRLLLDEIKRRPHLAAAWGLLVLVLYAARGKFKRRLAQLAPAAVAVEHYRIGHTLAALVYTALLALPGALLLWGIGSALQQAQAASAFAQALGHALVLVGNVFLAMYGFSWLFDARGVAVRHFLWPADAMTAVQRAIRRFMLVYVPLVLVAAMNSSDYAPHANRESLGRLAFIFGMAALALFVWHLFRRSSPVMQALLPATSHSWASRLHPLWASALIALPVGLAILAAAGFYFAAVTLYRLSMRTLALVLAAVILYGMVALWVLIQRARLSRRQAAQSEEDAIQVVSESGTTLRPVALDIATLGERTSRLLNLVTTVLLLAGLWAIWKDWLPFLSALGDAQLWTYNDTVMGEQVVRALTIGGLVLAVVTLILTYVAARNVGAVLDIVVLQRLELQRDITYGIKTVLRYAIAVAGLVFASNILGVSWSKAQWLVAALGVGLGFGLQEIVANFVSGLIVLGERPIRVADVVTVGDVTGTVTSIRARATVVTDFDNKEIMIPNKAFITERVINWTLSNQTTRLLIPVGIAYGTPVERAQRVMLTAVESIEDVLREPAPSVFFVGFGDSSLNFEIRAFVDAFDRRLPVRHQIHVAVERALAGAGIEIPFPQRDLHIRSAEGLEQLLPRAGTSAN